MVKSLAQLDKNVHYMYLHATRHYHVQNVVAVNKYLGILEFSFS